jgi:hypothetical protein
MNVTSDKGWHLVQPVSHHGLWTPSAWRIGAVLCALVACSAALAQVPPEDLSSLGPDQLLDRLLELNDAARQRYDSIEFTARVTASRLGGADRRTEVVHVLLDKGRLRLEHVQDSASAAWGTEREIAVLLRCPEYVAEWQIGSQSNIYQYKRGSDGQVPGSGRVWDSPYMGTQGVAWRLCGNGQESLSTHRRSATGIVWRAQPADEQGVYLLVLGNGPTEVRYTIDGTMGFVITRVVSTRSGRTVTDYVHTLGEAAPGVWFPSRTVKTSYGPDGRAADVEATDFTDVRINPPVTDRDFTIESLPVPPGTRLVVTHPDGRMESFELPGNASGTTPADAAAPEPKRITELSKPATPISSAELRGPSVGRYFIIVAFIAAAAAIGLWLRLRRQQARQPRPGGGP